MTKLAKLYKIKNFKESKKTEDECHNNFFRSGKDNGNLTLVDELRYKKYIERGTGKARFYEIFQLLIKSVQDEDYERVYCCRTTNDQGSNEGCYFVLGKPSS